MVLHGYWRSTSSYRVRIALNLKGIEYDQVTHDLRTGEQAAPDYVALNPQRLVPTLDTGDVLLTQSIAIIEWLEEQYPEPRLLPEAPHDRAAVRAMSDIVACDIHPLNNVRVLNAIKNDLGANATQTSAWISHWIQSGFTAIEALIEKHGGTYAFGDMPTMADCCLVPQLYSAERFEVDVSAYPRILAATEAASRLPAFEKAHPSRQPDAD
ncbi:maleylacetoacetate isomerase [Sphingobium sp. AP50]|uniref:maleylacetoacetate isomerase n=1 Tax=Sphingobium sp. AP50 TaxID=1884369 RepID=UPI000B8931B7|nr:maleylacetoacetate isomerase [Sphingobium sp. AP50]